MPNHLAPTPGDRLRHLLGNRGWPRALALRRLTAAALIMLAALLALRPVTGATEPTEPVIVAARDLAPGTTLSEADVRVVHAPSPLRPAAGLGSLSDVTGRVLASPAGTGEPITTTRLIGPDHTRLVTGRPDAVAVPVRLADAAVADLLTPGTRVDVVTTDPHGASTLLATDATVLTIRPDTADRSPATRPGRLVVVALPRDTATRVAATSLSQPLTMTLH